MKESIKESSKKYIPNPFIILDSILVWKILSKSYINKVNLALKETYHWANSVTPIILKEHSSPMIPSTWRTEESTTDKQWTRKEVGSGSSNGPMVSLFENLFERGSKYEG